HTGAIILGNHRYAGLGVLQPLGTRFAYERDNVMDQRAVAWTGFGHANPLVFFEPCGHDNVRVFDRALRGYVYVLRHLEFDVRLADAPSLDKAYWRRGVFGIAFRSTGVGPSYEGIDLFLGKRTVVREVSIARVGKPWRHLLQEHGLTHCFRQGTRLLIGKQGEGSG